MKILAGRPGICLICQARQLRLSRRRIVTSHPRAQPASSVAIYTRDDALPLEARPEGAQKYHSKKTLQQMQHHGEEIPMTSREEMAMREATLHFEALCAGRDARVRTLRALSNPWPEVVQKNHHHQSPRSNELQNQHIPHAIFRQNMKTAVGQKAIRQVLRAQLLRCEWPRDVLKVVAVAMQERITAVSLTHLYEPLMRALYRCRNNVTDPEVLNTLHAIIMRYRHAKLGVEPLLLYMALKFAARSRSKLGMQRYLRMIREEGLGMSSNVYRSVIAKCSIGHRGLGEIRNGRWRKSDLREVLLGFRDCVDIPESEQYHFGTFLVRDDWQYLHGWIAVLARCREAEVIWREWELWKETKAYKEPRKLVVPGEGNVRKAGVTMTNKLRGVYWFTEQMVLAGDLKRGWQILREADVPFHRVKQSVRRRMLDEPEHAGIWDEGMRNEMLAKYDTDLAQIEEAFGVRWVESEAGEGCHELYMDQEEALDKLGSESWRKNDETGYPLEDDLITMEYERKLHDAEESHPGS